MIGNVIKTLREQKGLSKHRLAQLANIPRSNLYKIESGKSLNPGWYTITNIARALGISLDELNKLDLQNWL